MELPKIIAQDVEYIISGCKVIGSPCHGGQKLVFPCEIHGQIYAIKFLKATLNNSINNEMQENVCRCKREVATLSICNSPNLIKIGPIKLSSREYNGDQLLFFSEQWIIGKNLAKYFNDLGGILDNNTIVQLGIDISFAIEELWKHHKIHRDIKPENIMFNNIKNNFILLDMGMVYDSSYNTLTKYGYLPGTLGYYSPEQFNLNKKIELDFRSDLFCLGIVLYQAATNIHPFKNGTSNKDIIFDNIIRKIPTCPSDINTKISKKLSDVIMRLLKKRPSERYRSCNLLRIELNNCINR